MAKRSARDQVKGANVGKTQQCTITTTDSQLRAARAELHMSIAQRDEYLEERHKQQQRACRLARTLQHEEHSCQETRRQARCQEQLARSASEAAAQETAGMERQLVAHRRRLHERRQRPSEAQCQI